MSNLSQADVLALVNDGKLTILDRPDWLDERGLADLHLANAGDMNAAARIADLLAPGWTWRIGYDNLAELVWWQDGEPIELRAISLSPAHALLMGALQAAVIGPQGVKDARAGASPEAVATAVEADLKIGD